MMNLIHKYRIIIAFVLPVLILLAIRTFTTGSFKYDAKKWSESSFDCSNLISRTEFEKLQGEKLIFFLDDSYTKNDKNSTAEVHVPPDSVLEREYLNIIKDHKGSVLICSSDPALSARIWMVISQTGCTNLYILAGKNEDEVFKNEFRPDTLVKPEL
jgi:hypothetical protein